MLLVLRQGQWPAEDPQVCCTHSNLVDGLHTDLGLSHLRCTVRVPEIGSTEPACTTYMLAMMPVRAPWPESTMPQVCLSETVPVCTTIPVHSVKRQSQRQHLQHMRTAQAAGASCQAAVQQGWGREAAQTRPARARKAAQHRHAAKP